MSVKLEDYIASVPDFPKEGILFRDVSPILRHPEALKETVHQLSDFVKDTGATVIAGPEARGFVFGCPVAYEAELGFVPIRKPGKLPGETVSVTYDLEYGTSEIHMPKGSIKPSDKVLIIDDLLATGGTAKACAHLIESQGAEVVGYAFVVELFGDSMDGRKVLDGYNVFSLMRLSDQ